MESRGGYWKPVWQALEGSFQLTLANPFQVKNIPGQKTDSRDSQWLAELLAHGLIRPSFVPPRETRGLRDLTRYRVKLTEERNRIHNRIHKVLEDACIKLDTIASDILGASRRRLLRPSSPARSIRTGWLTRPRDFAGQAPGTWPCLAGAHHRAPQADAARTDGRSGVCGRQDHAAGEGDCATGRCREGWRGFAPFRVWI